MKAQKSIGVDVIFPKIAMEITTILLIILATLWKILKNGTVKCLILRRKKDKLGTNKFAKILITS